MRARMLSPSDAIIAAGRTPPRGHRNPRLHVLAEGDGWLVVAKPPRVISHRNKAHPHEYAMLQRVRDLVGSRVWLVHRLDRATSGCQLFATRQELAGPLSKALATGQKTYLAMVRGFFATEGSVRVDTPIKVGPDNYKDAVSTVRWLGRSHEPRCSLLEVKPETGRNHQVRRHVRDLHHPVLRDGYHGDSRVNRWWRESYGMARLGLHASDMSLEMPDGTSLSVNCPLFVDHAVLFRRMPWWDDAVARHPGLDGRPLPLIDHDPMVDELGAPHGWASRRTIPLETSP